MNVTFSTIGEGDPVPAFYFLLHPEFIAIFKNRYRRERESRA
jgi:hypothetical protein